MHEQLLLLRTDADQPWRLDEHTRDVGRRGVEEARSALRQVAGRETVAAPRRHLPARTRTAA